MTHSQDSLHFAGEPCMCPPCAWCGEQGHTESDCPDLTDCPYCEQRTCQVNQDMCPDCWEYSEKMTELSNRRDSGFDEEKAKERYYENKYGDAG